MTSFASPCRLVYVLNDSDRGGRNERPARVPTQRPPAASTNKAYTTSEGRLSRRFCSFTYRRDFPLRGSNRVNPPPSVPTHKRPSTAPAMLVIRSPLRLAEFSGTCRK